VVAACATAANSSAAAVSVTRILILRLRFSIIIPPAFVPSLRAAIEAAQIEVSPGLRPWGFQSKAADRDTHHNFALHPAPE
jgi:hypothetical protein